MSGNPASGSSASGSFASAAMPSPADKGRAADPKETVKTDTASTAPATAAGPAASSDDGGSKLFGRGLLYVVVWSLQLVVSSLISPFLTHLVGPAEFGALSSAMAVYQVLTVAALLGLDEVLVLERADGPDGGARARGLVSVAVVLSFVVTGLALVTIPLWSGPLGFSGFPLLLVAVILWTAPSASVTVMLALLVAEDRLRPFALVSIISAVGGSIVGMVLLLTVHRDATTYAWGGVICQFLALAIGLVIVRPTLRGFSQWAVTSRAIRLGVPLALGSLAFFVLNAGDRIILQRELGATEVGRYQVAYVIGSAVILLLNFTNGAWTPHFAALKSDVARYALGMKSRDELYRILVPIVLGVTLVAPLALRILAPASFRPDGLTVVVLLVALTAFPVAASGATGRLLVIGRRGKTVGVIAGVAAVVNVVLNLILVPTSLGIAGAAVATLASYSLLAVLQVVFLPDRSRWHGAPRRLVMLVVAAVAIAAISTLFPQTLAWNIARALLAVACFPWFVVRLRAARSGASSPLPEEKPAPVEEADDDGDADGLSRLFGPMTDDDHVTPADAGADDSDADEVRVTSASGDGDPGPRRVLSIDLEQPVPELTADYRYRTAMVVGYRGAVPVGAVDVRLTDDPADAAHAMRPLFELPLPERPADDLPVDDADLPGISVIVSTVVARPDDLALLLAAFARIEYPRVEFLLVDNRVTTPADDVLPALVADYTGVRVVREPRPGVAAGRNAGIAAATNEIVAFTDDDVRVDDNWLRVIGRRFARADAVDALTGLILPAELETPAQIWFEGYYGGFAGERQFAPVTLEAVGELPRLVRGSKIAAIDSSGREVKRFPVYGIGAYGAGANMAFRRTALLHVGGFDAALGTGTPSLGGEDLATLVQILWSGGRVAVEPTAVVHHRHRRSLPELERQLHGYGLGFTAMLTSLVLDDPRHLVALGWQVPSAAGRFAKQATNRVLHRARPASGAASPEKTSDDLSGGYPKSLVSTELRGFPRGPGAYLRSRRTWSAVNRDDVCRDDAIAEEASRDDV